MCQGNHSNVPQTIARSGRIIGFFSLLFYNSLMSALTRFETIKLDNDTKENNDLFIDLFTNETGVVL